MADVVEGALCYVDDAKSKSGTGMTEMGTIGLDNLAGPSHLPGKFEHLSVLCQLASLSSPCALAWLAFRKSCHDCPADRRICATIPSACLRGVALEVGVSGWRRVHPHL